jgi:hypothetical protein
VSKNTGKSESEPKNRETENQETGDLVPVPVGKNKKTGYPNSGTRFLAPGNNRVTKNRGTTYIYNYILIFFSLCVGLVKFCT